MLTTSVERVKETLVKLTVTVPVEEVNAAIAEAYNQVGSKLRIPGFRKGKAPRPVVDNYVGREYVLTEATEWLVNETYPRAVDAERLRPIESPEVDELDVVQNDEPFTFSLEVELRPELKLDSYEGIKVEVPRRAVNDADIEAQLLEIRDRFATLQPAEGRGVQKDDYVLLSFVGYVDGETYEGNVVDKYLYEMNHGLMPAEFDEGIMGVKPGEEKRVEFTIPDTSSNPEFVGKPAQFDVTVHEIKEKALPPVDDAFANEMGFETVQAMYDDMRSRLDLQRLMAYDQAKEKGAREELAKRLPGEIPDVMIKARAKSLATDFNNRLQGQGLTLDQYIGMTGVSKEVFEEQILSDAEELIREDLALEALFRELGMEVTDEDMDRELQDMAQASGESMEETRAKWEKLGLNAVVAEGVMHRRAVGWLMENVEVDERPDEPAAEPEAAEGTKKATKKRAPKKKPESAEGAESETAPAEDQS